MSQTQALVETLTAEVRVLMIGNRQVTLSVFKQLDYAQPSSAEIMGRVRATTFTGPTRRNDWQEDAGVEWVGRHTKTGALVRGFVPLGWSLYRTYTNPFDEEQAKQRKAFFDYVSALPLIVLAGLK